MQINRLRINKVFYFVEDKIVNLVDDGFYLNYYFSNTLGSDFYYFSNFMSIFLVELFFLI